MVLFFLFFHLVLYANCNYLIVLLFLFVIIQSETSSGILAKERLISNSCKIALIWTSFHHMGFFLSISALFFVFIF